MADLLIPSLLLFVSAAALTKKLDLYALLQEGATDGLHISSAPNWSCSSR